MPDFREVDPRSLILPNARSAGANSDRLNRQISKHGASTEGMPPIAVFEAVDGALVVYNGVTRATRIAKLAPGTLVLVEVIGRFKHPAKGRPKIGDFL